MICFSSYTQGVQLNNEIALTGIAKAVIHDGVVENNEIIMMHEWLQEIDLPVNGPLSELRKLIDTICSDGEVSSKERIVLLQFLRNMARHVPSAEKGYDFEKYVLSRFDKKMFRLRAWRGDKHLRGWGSPISNSYPDLELEEIATGHKFAIECKYRKNLQADKFVWATPKKMSIYNSFQSEKNMIVFVAFGIGGKPSMPHFTAVMPLNSIKYAELYKSKLAPFQVSEEFLTLDYLRNMARRVNCSAI